MNTNRCARFAAMRLRSLRPASPSGTAAMMRLSRRSIEVGEIVLQRDVLQRVSSSPDSNSPQQQPLEWCTEGGIAALDGIARIAQQMCQAHLPFDGVAALAAQHVGHPDHRPDLAKQGLNDGLAPTGA